MKVIAFNGSGRKDGNTALLLIAVLDQLTKEGIQTELIQLAGNAPQGCIACYKCFENKDRKCAVTKDRLNEYLAKMIEADGILLGSPVYFADATAGIKALIERCGMVSVANGGLFKRKVAAAVAAVRRAGAIVVPLCRAVSGARGRAWCRCHAPAASWRCAAGGPSTWSTPWALIASCPVSRRSTQPLAFRYHTWNSTSSKGFPTRRAIS